MITKLINRLIILTLALWLIPWEGKKYFPQIIGNPYVQWTCAIFLAIMIPLGSLLTLYVMLHDSKKRRLGFFAIITFSFPLLINILSIGMLQPFVINNTLIFGGVDRDNLGIRTLSTCTLEGENVQKRKRAAQILYQHYGIETTFLDKNQTFLRYYPTKLDLEQWEKIQLQNRQISSMREEVGYQLKQFPWLFALYVGTYVVIMTIGLGVFSFKRSANKPME